MSLLLERLVSELRDEGGLLAGALMPVAAGAATPHGDVAARGPRAAGREEEVALVVEAVREGYLAHYGEARVLDTTDADLALLAGDRLYALGLSKLADAGDVGSIVELADVIALSAVAHAAEDPDLADAVWAAGAGAVGWGPVPALAHAKAAVRAQAPGAASALRAVARQLVRDVAP